jgi:hypothetical protein
MADKLDIWRQALLHLGKATIDTLADDVEAVNVFNNAWDGVVEEAFNSGDWNFAKKSTQLSQSSTGTAATGWTYVFDYPSDYLRTVAVSPYAGFSSPFYDYVDEGGYLSANTPSIYLRFISDTKVADPTTWPTMFWRYVALLLAGDTCEKLTNGSTMRADLERRTKDALRKARSVDARNENNKRIAPGSWLRSRNGFNTGGSSGGGTLVGGEITLGEGEV